MLAFVCSIIAHAPAKLSWVSTGVGWGFLSPPWWLDTRDPGPGRVALIVTAVAALGLVWGAMRARFAPPQGPDPGDDSPA